MIQFNLLPDVKLEYIRAQRSRRLILSVSVVVSAAAIALLALMLSIDGLQRKHLGDLTKDIKSETAKLQQEPQLNKILTVQNQLESLTALHDQKPAAGRLFTYLNELTPVQVNITSLHIDYVLHTATMTGTTDALSTVNKFVDTLKFTTYAVADPSSPSASPATGTKAFSNVVLSTFGLSGSLKGAAQASYTIAFSYDPTIFDTTKTVTLSVPNLITTRSEIDKPTDLFTAAPTTTSGGGQ